MKSFIYYLLIFALLSCGATEEEEVDDAIISANIALNAGNCQRAIDILEDLGRQNFNARYLKTLSSAYACRAGYSTLTFIDTDAPRSGSPSELGGFARYTTSSSMDAYDNDQYDDLWVAIDLLLYAGNLSRAKDPTIARRAAIFSPDDATDINSQLFFMIMVQLGKYLYYYGDSSVSGVKGSGGSSLCLVNYDDATSNTFINGATTGACTNAGNVGHIDLGLSGSLNISRMCEGVVLVNLFLDLFSEVAGQYSGGDLDVISSLNVTTIDAALGVLAGQVTVTSITQVISETKCAADLGGVDTDIQRYFAFVIETMFR